MIVSLVRYLKPDARPEAQYTEVSDHYGEAYEEMRRRGYWLTIEARADGAQAISVENRRREADCEIAPNPASIRPVVEAMLHRRPWRKQAPKVNQYAAFQ